MPDGVHHTSASLCVNAQRELAGRLISAEVERVGKFTRSAAGFVDGSTQCPRSGDANAAVSTRAEAPQTAGQVLVAKIANVKVYAEPSREAKVVATLQRSDELVASGEVKNGFVYVDSSNFSGWVPRTLVGPR